ncbi:MAG: DUF3124 domain-containing protein [Chloroflexi bacterium]|nr:DUF3124 domain-containing protein [Chloroflexota bacterium]
MIQIHRIGWLVSIILLIGLTGCAAEATLVPPTPRPNQERVQIADLEIVTGQTIYVPAYSDIYFDANKSLDLAITLSVHNTDLAHSIVLTSVRYYNTQGQLVQEFISQPRPLGPLEAVDFFVPPANETGGVGANFIVEWGAEQPVYEPVVEAVMIGTITSLGFSFTSPGRVISQTGTFGE